jgi:hypothetical protein
MSITISNSKVTFGPNVVTSGLALYLDAANPDSYPGTGTILYDISGNNQHHTIVGAPIVK